MRGAESTRSTSHVFCQQRRDCAFWCKILIIFLDFDEQKGRAEYFGNNHIYLRFLSEQDGTIYKMLRVWLMDLYYNKQQLINDWMV